MLYGFVLIHTTSTADMTNPIDPKSNEASKDPVSNPEVDDEVEDVEDEASPESAVVGACLVLLFLQGTPC